MLVADPGQLRLVVWDGSQNGWVSQVAAQTAAFDRTQFVVDVLDKQTANALVVRHHYLHRKPQTSHAFGLYSGGEVVGAVTFGPPASRHLQMSACPSEPNRVSELNRLWVADECPRNSESFFVAHALKLLPPLVVVSYADTAWGHFGYIYRALGFRYAGWTDMERATPRYDYIAPDNKHTRDSFRGGEAQWTHRVRRKPKAKYWIVTGDRRERRDLGRLVGWPSIDWHDYPVPTEHVQMRLTKKAA